MYKYIIYIYIYICRASGPRRGEITVVVVASRGFNPSPYPSPGGPGAKSCCVVA